MNHQKELLRGPMGSVEGLFRQPEMARILGVLGCYRSGLEASGLRAF